MSFLATALALAAGLVGNSVEGRAIHAERIGPAGAPVKVLVVGSIHGNEPAGKAVVARLRHLRPPRGTALWLVYDANPDGAAANRLSIGFPLHRPLQSSAWFGRLVSVGTKFTCQQYVLPV